MLLVGQDAFADAWKQMGRQRADAVWTFAEDDLKGDSGAVRSIDFCKPLRKKKEAILTEVEALSKITIARVCPSQPNEVRAEDDAQGRGADSDRESSVKDADSDEDGSDQDGGSDRGGDPGKEGNKNDREFMKKFVRKGSFRDQQRMQPSWQYLAIIRSIVGHMQADFQSALRSPVVDTSGWTYNDFRPPRGCTSLSDLRAHLSLYASPLETTMDCLRANKVLEAQMKDCLLTLQTILPVQNGNPLFPHENALQGILRRVNKKQRPFKKGGLPPQEREEIIAALSLAHGRLVAELARLDGISRTHQEKMDAQDKMLSRVRLDDLVQNRKTALDTSRTLADAFTGVVAPGDDDDTRSEKSAESHETTVSTDPDYEVGLSKDSSGSSSCDDVSSDDYEGPPADDIEHVEKKIQKYSVDDLKLAQVKYGKYESCEVILRFLRFVPLVGPTVAAVPQRLDQPGHSAAQDTNMQRYVPTGKIPGLQKLVQRAEVLERYHKELVKAKRKLSSETARDDATKEREVMDVLQSLREAFPPPEEGGEHIPRLHEEVSHTTKKIPRTIRKIKSNMTITLQEIRDVLRALDMEMRFCQTQRKVTRFSEEPRGQMATSDPGHDGTDKAMKKAQDVSARLHKAHTLPKLRSLRHFRRKNLYSVASFQKRTLQPRLWHALSIFLFYLNASKLLHRDSVMKGHVQDVLDIIQPRCMQILLYLEGRRHHRGWSKDWDFEGVLHCMEVIQRFDPKSPLQPSEIVLPEAFQQDHPDVYDEIKGRMKDLKAVLASLSPSAFPLASDTVLTSFLQSGKEDKERVLQLQQKLDLAMELVKPYTSTAARFVMYSEEKWAAGGSLQQGGILPEASKSWWRSWLLRYKAQSLQDELLRPPPLDDPLLRRRLRGIQLWRRDFVLDTAVSMLDAAYQKNLSAIQSRITHLQSPLAATPRVPGPASGISAAVDSPVADGEAPVASEDEDDDYAMLAQASSEAERVKSELATEERSKKRLNRAKEVIGGALRELQAAKLACSPAQLSGAAPANQKKFLFLQERAEDEAHCSIHNVDIGDFNMAIGQGKAAGRLVEKLATCLITPVQEPVSRQQRDRLDDIDPGASPAGTWSAEESTREDLFFQEGVIAETVEAVEQAEDDLQLLVVSVREKEQDRLREAGVFARKDREKNLAKRHERAVHTCDLYRSFICEDFDHDSFHGVLDATSLESGELREQEAPFDGPSLIRSWFVKVLCISHNSRFQGQGEEASHAIFHSLVRDEHADPGPSRQASHGQEATGLPGCTLFEGVWARYTLSLRDSLLLSAWTHYRQHRAQADVQAAGKGDPAGAAHGTSMGGAVAEDQMHGDAALEDQMDKGPSVDDEELDPDQVDELHLVKAQALVRFCLSVLACGRAMAPQLLQHPALDLQPPAGMRSSTPPTASAPGRTKFEESVFGRFADCYDRHYKPWVTKTREDFLEKHPRGRKWIDPAIEVFFVRLDERCTGPPSTFTVYNLTAADKQARRAAMEIGEEVPRPGDIDGPQVLKTSPQIPIRFPWCLDQEQIEELFHQYIFQDEPMEGFLVGSVADEGYTLEKVIAWCHAKLPEDDPAPENPAEAVDKYVEISASCQVDPLLATEGHGFLVPSLPSLEIRPYFRTQETLHSVRQDFAKGCNLAAASWLSREFVCSVGGNYSFLQHADGRAIYRGLVHFSSVEAAGALYRNQLGQELFIDMLKAMDRRKQWPGQLTPQTDQWQRKMSEFYSLRMQQQKEWLAGFNAVLQFRDSVVDMHDNMSIAEASTPRCCPALARPRPPDISPWQLKLIADQLELIHPLLHRLAVLLKNESLKKDYDQFRTDISEGRSGFASGAMDTDNQVSRCKTRCQVCSTPSHQGV